MTIFFCILHRLLPGYGWSLDTFSLNPYSDQDVFGWSSPPPPLPASENITLLIDTKSPSEQQHMRYFPGISGSNLSYSWKSDSLEDIPSLRDLPPCLF